MIINMQEDKCSRNKYHTTLADSDDFDSHCCTDFIVDGGYCEYCGSLVPGTPAYFNDRGVDDWCFDYYSQMF